MAPTRRKFLTQTALAGGLVPALAGCAAANLFEAPDQPSGGPPVDRRQTKEKHDMATSLVPLDYGRSFLCNPSPENSVRFWIESRTLLYEPGREAPHDFWQCASCKSENTFGERDLFYADNYDFLPILGNGYWLTFRRTASLNPGYRELRRAVDVWGEPELELRRMARAEELPLDDWEAIRDATAAAAPIVAQTELHDADSGRRAVLEYPVKTMNISHTKRMYQVDTGPLALCDLSRAYDPPLDSVRLAFVAFNAPDFADFVIEQPTPLSTEDPASPQVHHYSSPVSLPARNRLFALYDR